jgi:hypothetical protein
MYYFINFLAFSFPYCHGELVIASSSLPQTWRQAHNVVLLGL